MLSLFPLDRTNKTGVAIIFVAMKVVKVLTLSSSKGRTQPFDILPCPLDGLPT
jgi:hypothetical protein